MGAEAPGACFVVALRFILTHPDAPGARLVYGVVQEEGLWWPHAWCEADAEDGGNDGVVLDPSSMRFYSRQSFYDVLAATPITTYTPAQARARAKAALHDDAERWGETGPWAEYNRAVSQLVERRLGEVLACHPDLGRWLGAMLERRSSSRYLR